MKTKTILNISTGLLTVGGVSAGSLYALNKGFKKEAKSDLNPQENKLSNQQQVATVTKGTKSIKEALKEGGLNLLNTTTDENKQDWENLIKKMLDKSVSDEEKISAVVITTSNPTQDATANMKNIKDACNLLFEKSEDKDTSFAKNKKLAENWCTKESKFLKLQA